MSESSQAAEQIIKMTLDGTEYAVRIAGSIGTELAKKLSDAMRSSRPSRGRNRLKELLRSGKELSLFSIQNRDVNRFAKEARRYGITFSMVKDRNEKDPRSGRGKGEQDKRQVLKRPASRGQGGRSKKPVVPGRRSVREIIGKEERYRLF